MRPEDVLRLNGGFATRSQLRAAGMSDAAMRRALAAGALVAIGRKVVADPHADADLLRAVRMGGRVACVTAARARGLWAVDDGRFHVAPRRLGGDAHPDAGTPPAVLHWTRHPLDAVGDRIALESVVNMLAHIAKCQPLDYAVAVFDSAVRTGQVLYEELQRLARSRGGRFQQAVLLTSTQADSGLESITRVRLGWAGVVAREQVRIDGHRVDLLVGERLVIQLDGRQHADPGELNRDRWQDRRLQRMGFTVLRYGYGDVLHHWDAVLSEVAAAMAAGRHLG